MNFKSKIKAFTLSEMIVVLILTTIIAGLAFSIITLVNKHIYSIQNNLSYHTELLKLKQSLTIDFNRYHDLNYDNTAHILSFKNGLNEISYEFQDTYIVKDIDTFNVHIARKDLFFDGENIKSGQVDAVKLQMLEKQQNQILFIFKNNDATQFIK